MITKPKLEIADIFRVQGEAFLKSHPASSEQRRAVYAISHCRTAALGAHRMMCNECEYQNIAYNSCRNRHCPKCQGQAQAEWISEQMDKLLPVTYFHIVFTLPDELSPIALQNQRVVYDILFSSAWETIKTIAGDPKHLGAEMGMTAVLHTWGQTLTHHPHLHCIVPGGGISPDKKQWIESRYNYFLPVKVLSILFRRLFLANLYAAFKGRMLEFHGKLASLSNPSDFIALLDPLHKKNWVVYAKRPFGSPAQVINYLGRYTHRVAISNYRLISFEDGKVTFKWRDYRDNNIEKRMTLEASEFIRRFLLHVLPSGFVRIRHYGFLSTRNSPKLAMCLKLITQQAKLIPIDTTSISLNLKTDNTGCPQCKRGKMCLAEIISAELLNRKNLTLTAVPP